ncbi:carboxylesterase/lipase family protein [Paenibacillus taichungensis]|uniref:carboxylesterase/lipase family protein n=1 Tax=Paenibacillus taichungensis TaxID=484184 RepID=UPI0039A51ADF
MSELEVKKNKNLIIWFWAPFMVFALITALLLFTRESRLLEWVLFAVVGTIAIFMRKPLVRLRTLFKFASWILTSAFLGLIVILTGPILVNRSVWNDEMESMPTEPVETQDGLISGLYNEDKSVRAFAAIPYATPPVGELRWKAPQPVQPWKGVRELKRFPNAAMQKKTPSILTNFINLRLGTSAFMDNFSIKHNEKISEDSLYLNVWSGAKSDQEKQPVLVYIHGGAFKNGSGSMDLYNGENMAKKGVIFVTINYRLGIFGFMAHPELTEESDYGASGNYGILDQIAALKWVKRNIAAFGGDPDNVTIAGESAGAGSVNILTASPLAKGLFNKAIAESGAFFDMERERTGGIYTQSWPKPNFTEMNSRSRLIKLLLAIYGRCPQRTYFVLLQTRRSPQL